MTDEEAQNLVLQHFPKARLARSSRVGARVAVRLYQSPGLFWCEATAPSYGEAKVQAWRVGAKLLRERYPVDPDESAEPFTVQAWHADPLTRVIVGMGIQVYGLREVKSLFPAFTGDEWPRLPELEGWVSGVHTVWNRHGESPIGPAWTLLLVHKTAYVERDAA